MKIKDLQSNIIREYGSNHHDSLSISEDGRTLSYYNLQCGDGSRFGDYRFVMDDGEVPQNSKEADAIYGEAYFNIGGFDKYCRQGKREELSEIWDYWLSHSTEEFAEWLTDRAENFLVG